MMNEAAVPQPPRKLSWRFPSVFWFANSAELCERAAYYGMFITLYRYLNTDVGFTDPETGLITGIFAGGLYFFPLLMGIMADKIGFKQALVIAFALLTTGYALLGVYQLKAMALLSLLLIMLGGAIVKPCISGTVAKSSDADHRARAMSIFYMIVNIGSFSGKGLAGYLNEALGLQYINFYSAGMSFVALILCAFFYRNIDTEGVGKTVKQALGGLAKVLSNLRFLSLIFIIAGFWIIQVQLYGAMPTYIERMLGKGYKPEWLANINPLVVVCCVVAITHLVRNFKPVSAIGISLAIIPFTAVLIASAPFVQDFLGGGVNLGWFTLHPLVVMIILGIGLQGLAECFLSPKWLEFVSKQAPKGEVGLYLGYSYLASFVSWMFGLMAAGVLLDSFCPDPRSLTPDSRHEWRLATDDKYRFTLPQSDRDLLKDALPAAELRAAFESRALPLADTTRLVELEPKDSWRHDPERRWVLYEPFLTLTRATTGDEAKQDWRVTVDSPSMAPPGRDVTLTSALTSELKNLGAPGAALRSALQQQGLTLPDNALAFKDGARRDASAEIWHIGVKEYLVEESKLETDADAAAAGREFARRELIVSAAAARADETLPRLPADYDRAHYIWYVFAAIGFTAFFALLIFKFVTDAIDRRAGIA